MYNFLQAAGSSREYDMFFKIRNALEVLPKIMLITKNLLAT
jgi:hypothetical protein